MKTLGNGTGTVCGSGRGLGADPRAVDLDDLWLTHLSNLAVRASLLVYF